MTDITELATVLRLAAESEIACRAEGDTSDLWQDEASPDNVLALVEALEKAQQVDEELCKLLPPGAEHMDPPDGGDVTPLEGVRRMVADYRQRIAELREWNAGLAQESCEYQQRIAEIQPIHAAAEKLIRCKGRYHSEQNYRALAALFGVKTPDLPPLEHENVHYADAAEMEIAALRQRIAELEESHAQVIQSRDHYKRITEEGLRRLAESRTVTVKLPDDEDGQAYGFGKWANGKLPATAGTMTIAYCEDAWRAAFEVFSSAAGIKWEAE
ncbi:ead/Ea22-like family protein [Klebsiella aerogenes]